MYLIDTFISPPGSPFIGGAEKQLYLLASGLKSGKFEPIIVQLSPDSPSSVSIGKMEGLEVLHFPLRKIYSPSGMRQIASLLRLARSREVDIIHTVFEKAEIVGWIIKRLAGVPIWITSRRDLGFKRKKIYDRIFKLSARDCHKCVANCRAVEEALMKQGSLPGEKIGVIYNGIDFNSSARDRRDNSLRSELGIKNDTPLVGMIANFNFEIKGHRYFLESVRTVLQNRPETRFLLVGDGPLRDKYEQMARARRRENNLLFLGKRGDVPAIISSLDVSVLSSTNEGFSNVILESMAAGKPVVATNVGGNKELVRDGETGYLVPPADPRALANGILKIIQNPGKALQMGNTGRKIAQEQFSTERMIKSYERLYASLIAGKEARRAKSSLPQL